MGRAHVGHPDERPQDRSKELPTVVALDAMGVLYRHGDVVTNLLVPYLRSKCCSTSPTTVRMAYRECTLGRFGTQQLWRELGVASTASDAEYCLGHELTDGLIPLLEAITSAGVTVACLTNDTAEWSAILRRRFNLDRYITHWYVSAEIGVRKPDPNAYDALLRGLDTAPQRVLFVDDRGPNVVSAQHLGMQTLLFTSEDTARHPVPPEVPRVHTMADLAAALPR